MLETQFFTVSGFFLEPVLLETAAYLFLMGSLPVAGVVLESVVFSLLESVTSVLHDTLLSTWQREKRKRGSFSHSGSQW